MTAPPHEDNERENQIIIGLEEGYLHHEAAVQCNLLHTRPIHQKNFDIKNQKERKRFVRRLYALLMAQYLCTGVCMTLVSLFTDARLPTMAYNICWVCLLFAYALLYKFRDGRRRSPLNVVVFVGVAVVHTVEEIIYALTLSSPWIFTFPLLLIFNLGLLCLFTIQPCLRFTNGRGIFMLLCVFVGYIVGEVFLTPYAGGFLAFRAFIWTGFVMYDSHLMVSGFHGYNLASDEYVYGVTNLYADLPLVFWLAFKGLFLDHTIAVCKFIWRCCRAEVC